MNKLKPILFALLALFITTAVFISCSNEETTVIKTQNSSENVSVFGEKYNKYTNEIGHILASNSLNLDDLTNHKTDIEIYKAIRNSDIDNKLDLIFLLKRQKTLVVDFAKNNKSFFESSIEDKKRMLTVALFPITKFNFATNKSLEDFGNCETARDLSRQREYEDHVNNTLSILTTVSASILYSGGILAPEAAALYLGATVWEGVRHNTASNRIDEDYQICMGRGNCLNKKIKPKYTS